MATLTINGAGAIEAALILPRAGRGTLTARLATQAGPQTGDTITLTFEDGTTYTATATGGGPERGTWHLKAVLGAAKLHELVPARFYQGIPRNTVLNDVINECGETPGVIDTPGVLLNWTRAKQPAWHLLENLLTDTGITWRFTPAGEIRIAPEDWPDGPDTHVVTSNAAQRILYCAPAWAAQPGQTIAGVQADTVIHRVGPNRGTEVIHE